MMKNTSRRTTLFGLGALGLSALGACDLPGSSGSSSSGSNPGGGGSNPGGGGSNPGGGGSDPGGGGTDPSGGGGGASPSPFTPDLLMTFDGTHGTPVGTRQLDGGGSLYTTYAGGFGALHSSAPKRGGRETSAALSIQAGSDGNPANKETMGDFGMYFRLPASLAAHDGDTLHAGVWIHVPAGFSFATNYGVLKFFRWVSYPVDSPYDGSNGCLDNWIMQGSGYSDDAESKPMGPVGTQTGWAMGNEFNHAAEPNAFPTKRIIPLSEWAYVEMMIKFTTNPAEHVRRIWVNDKLVAEFANTTTKYYDTAGELVTRTKPANETLEPGFHCPGLLLFTYWNGTAPKDQTLWVDAMAFHKNTSTLPATDELGNSMMGMANVG